MQNSIRQLANKIKKYLKLLAIIFLFAFLVFGSESKADIASEVSFCAGNICQSAEIPMTGCDGVNTLQYFYTQHIKPGGFFKIRFINKNPVDTSCALLFAITGFDAFDKNEGSYGHYNSNSRTNFIYPGSYKSDFQGVQTITPLTFKVEKGNWSGNIDFVMWFKILDNLEPGLYPFRIGVTEYGQNYTSPELKLFIDDNAPSNNNEGDYFSGAGNWQSCADRIDNDLNYKLDCADQNCLNKVGKIDCAVEGACLCESSETTCYDRFDNDFDNDGVEGGFEMGGDYDLETGADCRDLDCERRAGEYDQSTSLPSQDKLCHYKNEGISFPESCQDQFNNDADEGTAEANNQFSVLSLAYSPLKSQYRDCYDFDCWRKGQLPVHPCPEKESIIPGGCNDGIDNDYDDGLNTKDAGPQEVLTGADCQDYDCGYLELGDGSPCPKRENENPAWCFDGLDNDLDAYRWDTNQYVPNPTGGIDCGDNDCKGAQNHNYPFNICAENEFQIFQYNYCANPKGYLTNLQDGIDDDGDGLANCLDNKHTNDSTDCYQRFGNCGPCPSDEFWTFEACSDGLDNDFDGFGDCQDTDCANKVGQLNGVAYCGTENIPEKCSDGFDNDADGKIDCADPNCNNTGLCGTENTPEKCSDGFDNDADGKIDCLDSDCWGVGECAPKIETTACLSSTLFPIWQPNIPGALFVSGGTIRAAQTSKLRLSTPFAINLNGSGKYSSVTITIGNAVNPGFYFPFNLAKDCSFSGVNRDRFTNVTNDEGTVFQIQSKPDSLIDGFNLTLSCSLPADFNRYGETQYYPIAVDAIKSINDQEEAESGEQFFAVVVLEEIAPKIEKIEVIGLNQFGEVKIPYRSALYLRAVPETDPSGICRCDFWMGESRDGNDNVDCSPDDSSTCLKPFASNCQLAIDYQTEDIENYYIQASAQDGAGNQGIYGPSPAKKITINVTPIFKPNTQIRMDKTKPFYTSEETINFNNARFLGVEGSLSDGSCRILVDAKEIDSNIILEKVNDNEIHCHGSFAAPSQGEHKLQVKFTDIFNDEVLSPTAVFYVCDEGNSASPCDKADFDQDGVPERTFTTMYGPTFACDNCPQIYNPDQEDINANGVGDICEGEILDEQVCKNNPWITCQISDECDGGGECCSEGIGLCKITGQWCCSSDDCPKIGENGQEQECEKTPPWVETRAGNIYGGGIGRINEKPPPPEKYNAVFCLLSSGSIINWTSEKGCLAEDIGILKRLKSITKKFIRLFGQEVLSSLDIDGLDRGLYGRTRPIILEEDSQDILKDDFFSSPLAGQIYVHQGDLVIKSPITFQNSQGENSAAGTILIKGGDLRIEENIVYDSNTPDNISNLASAVFIVIEENSQGGNIIIDGKVKNLAGVFFAQGQIETGASAEILRINGLMIAEKFAFQRQRATKTEGSEIIIYDGRASLNPPPGLTDLIKTLPIIKETISQ